MLTPEKILKTCDKWPTEWMGLEKDVPYGQGLVEAMKPFILSLLGKKLAERTFNRHLENLWLLGGEIIRDVSMNEEYDEISPVGKLKDSISICEGPLCHHLSSESEQRSFDATCGKLSRFLEASIGQ